MTTPEENPEQNPLSSRNVLRWRSVTSSNVDTQPPRAALSPNQHIPALGGSRKRGPAETRAKQPGGERNLDKLKTSTQVKRGRLYLGRLWTD